VINQQPEPSRTLIYFCGPSLGRRSRSSTPLVAHASRGVARAATPALLEATLKGLIGGAEIYGDDGDVEVVVYTRRQPAATSPRAQLIRDLRRRTGLAFRARKLVETEPTVVEPVVAPAPVIVTAPLVAPAPVVVAAPVVAPAPKPVESEPESDSEPVARPTQQLVLVAPDPAMVDRVRRAIPYLATRRYAAGIWLLEEIRDAIGIEADETSQVAAALAVLADEGAVVRTRPGFYRLSPAPKKSSTSTAFSRGQSPTSRV